MHSKKFPPREIIGTEYRLNFHLRPERPIFDIHSYKKVFIHRNSYNQNSFQLLQRLLNRHEMKMLYDGHQ